MRGEDCVPGTCRDSRPKLERQDSGRDVFRASCHQRPSLHVGPSLLRTGTCGASCLVGHHCKKEGKQLLVFLWVVCVTLTQAREGKVSQRLCHKSRTGGILGEGRDTKPYRPGSKS